MENIAKAHLSFYLFVLYLSKSYAKKNNGLCRLQKKKKKKGLFFKDTKNRLLWSRTLSSGFYNLQRDLQKVKEQNVIYILVSKI